MCDCIDKFKKKMIGFDYKGKKVIKAKFISAAIMFSSFKLQATGEIELTLEGGKRPIKQSVVYSFCPLCGKKYPKNKE